MQYLDQYSHAILLGQIGALNANVQSMRAVAWTLALGFLVDRHLDSVTSSIKLLTDHLDQHSNCVACVEIGKIDSQNP